MMDPRSLLAWIALVGLSTIPADAKRLPVHVGGRVIAERDASMSFGWPGTYFETRLRGTAVRIRFDAPQDSLRLLIDDRQVRTFLHPGQVDLTIDDLAPAVHVVRLEKLTESQHGGSRFIGFFSVDGAVAVAWHRPARRIEFIGDSFTVGYGNTSPGVTCTETEVHDRTDTQQAFGPLVARHYDADYRINAYSGFGIVRNYAGTNPGLNLPSIYPRLKPDRDDMRERAGAHWRPDIIVVNLGTNDFSTPLGSGERWRDAAALHAAYRAGYATFLGRLFRLQPQAHFILMGSDAFFADIAQMADALGRHERARVTAVRFDGLHFDGCNFHPSLADHQHLAELVEKAIDTSARPWTAR